MSDNFLQDPDIGLRMIPTPASGYAGQVDLLYFTLLSVSGVLVVVLTGLVVWFGLRYRRGQGGERGSPLGRRASRRLEIGFAVALGLLFMGLFVWGSWLYLGLYESREADITVNIIAKQWMWKAQHPDGTREINTLHVPVGKAIGLRLTSQDVIHSFSLPALRLKRDAVPGFYTEAHFVATEPGEYRLFCAEYCGNDHARMRGKLVVMSQEDYDTWRNGQEKGLSPVAAGKELFQSAGCAGCHASPATAPALGGLFGTTETLSDGSTVTVDESYLRSSILNPQQDLVEGYSPTMPSYSGQLSEGEVLELIAYIKSLPEGALQNNQGAEQ